jgi:TolB-like protein/DNA-binding SARP family transcriptional activator/Tfp pilus assembly protein PilF
MAFAELRLFGEFELRLASGEVVNLLGQKDRALLAILALPAGTTHSRDKLASLLWSDRGDQQARDSLKHALTKLRQCLPPASQALIVAGRLSARLDPAAVTIDVAEFERLVHEGAPQALERAIALYRGDLLDGIGIRDPAFEEWLLVERQRLRHMFEQALSRQITQSMANGARERAGTAARRLLSLDPLREDACRALMQIQAERGETAQALKLYEVLRERLNKELGVKPAPETTRLYDAILYQRTASGPNRIPDRAEGGEGTARLSLPDKPSIAVLPFENLSNDPEQEYFADGMVEEIIIALSRMKWLFVIARNSSFTYKGRAVDVKQVGRELGVRYVLEGSVRKAGNKVRITGQLIDASTNAHLWADRFEGTMDAIFELQDQVTERVVGAIAPKLEQAEIERARRKPTASLDAYDCYLRGLAEFYRFTKEGSDEALSRFRRAIELDPDFAAAHGMAARCYAMRKAGRWMSDPASEIAEAGRLARRAIALGPDDAVALCTAGFAIADVVDDPADGDAVIDRAIALNPNLVSAWIFSGWVKISLGEPEAAIERISHAMRLSPHDPYMFGMQSAMASAHLSAGRYAEALFWAEKSIRTRPDYLLAVCIVAASRGLAEQIEDARKAVEVVLRLDPELRISNLKSVVSYLREHDFAKWVDGLRKAGIPE